MLGDGRDKAVDRVCLKMLLSAGPQSLIGYLEVKLGSFTC